MVRFFRKATGGSEVEYVWGKIHGKHVTVILIVQNVLKDLHNKKKLKKTWDNRHVAKP